MSNFIRKWVHLRCSRGHEYKVLSEKWSAPEGQTCTACNTEWSRITFPRAEPTGITEDEAPSFLNNAASVPAPPTGETP